MLPDAPIYASDFLGIFNRNEDGFVVRFKRPGRSAIAADVHPDDVNTFLSMVKADGQRDRHLIELDVSMLKNFRIEE